MEVTIYYGSEKKTIHESKPASYASILAKARAVVQTAGGDKAWKISEPRFGSVGLGMLDEQVQDAKEPQSLRSPLSSSSSP